MADAAGLDPDAGVPGGRVLDRQLGQLEFPGATTRTAR
jgi:hypothetical protein